MAAIGASERILVGVARSRRRAKRFSLWMAGVRERGLREGFFGGSRLWMVIGAVTWTARIVSLAARHRPEAVYTTRLRKGETLVIVEHPPGWRPGRD